VYTTPVRRYCRRLLCYPSPFKIAPLDTTAVVWDLSIARPYEELSTRPGVCPGSYGWDYSARACAVSGNEMAQYCPVRDPEIICQRPDCDGIHFSVELRKWWINYPRSSSTKSSAQSAAPNSLVSSFWTPIPASVVRGVDKPKRTSFLSSASQPSTHWRSGIVISRWKAKFPSYVRSISWAIQPATTGLSDHCLRNTFPTRSSPFSNIETLRVSELSLYPSTLPRSNGSSVA